MRKISKIVAKAVKAPAKQSAAKAPVIAKPAPALKPVAAAKPVHPLVSVAPVASAKPATTERAKLIGEAYEHSAKFYAGASNTVHAKAPPKLSDIITRIRNPIQKPANGPTERDEAQLITALRFADPKTGIFDAVQRGFDLGVCSRNAASGFYAVHASGMPMLTPAGIERARAAAKRHG